MGLARQMLGEYRARLRWEREMMTLREERGVVIYSREADLAAVYGEGVAINEDVIVTNDVEVGDWSYVGPHSTLNNCTIGRYCSIAAGVHVCPVQHNLVATTTHPVAMPEVFDKRAPVMIGHDVLISLNVVIMPGVTIGTGAVIGAGTVVTHDVDPYCIVGGVPARPLRPRFDETTVARLLELAWWDWPRERVLRNKAFLADPSLEPVA